MAIEEDLTEESDIKVDTDHEDTYQGELSTVEGELSADSYTQSDVLSSEGILKMPSGPVWYQ